MSLFEPYQFKCSNGRTVRWFSKETIMYTNNGFSVEVWVDYKNEVGEGRVIYKSDIKEWTDRPPDTEASVSDEEKEHIVKCIIEFLSDRGVEDLAII